MSTDEGSLKVNDFTIDEGLQKILEAYRLQQAKSDTVVPEDHPILKRQNRINPEIKGLEGIVKRHLGESPRFDTKKGYNKAEAIVNELAYAFAQTKCYKGKLEEFKDENVRDYLGQIANATGNPIFSNKTALIRSILDLSFANPENDQYDKNSPLAQLIGYIAVQKDKPSEESGELSSSKLNYMRQVFAEKWNMLGKDGRAIPNAFTHKTGTGLEPYATGAEAFAGLERDGSYQLQGLITGLPKTHLKSGDDVATNLAKRGIYRG